MAVMRIFGAEDDENGGALNVAGPPGFEPGTSGYPPLTLGPQASALSRLGYGPT